MEAKTHSKGKKERNMAEVFMYRYLPYWPLFALLLIVSFISAGAYLYIAKPVYEISANLLIKVEKKGVDESKILEALNIYSSYKIVENEIQVIQSKELLRQVIDTLHLYAPVFEDGPIVSRSAYTSSPITIELENVDSIREVDRIDFTYSRKNNMVNVEGKKYPLDEWVSTSFGIAKFSKNPNYKEKAVRPLYFSLIAREEVLYNLLLNLQVSSANKNSSVINLTIKDEVRKRGQEILNLLIQGYNRAAINDKNLLTANTFSFIESRIKYVVKELDSIENHLQEFKTQKGVVDLSLQGKLYLESVGGNDRKMTAINMELAMMDEVEKYVLAKETNIGVVPSLVGLNDGMVPSVVGHNDGLLSQLLQKYYQSQMQYERMKKTIPGGNPIMFSLKNEIDNMKPTILENIQNQRLNLEASKNKLSAGTAKYASVLKTIPEKEKDLLNITRQQSIKNDAYSFLLRKREETAIANSAAVADSRVFDSAYASFVPVSPKKWLVFVAAFTVALLVGFVIVIGKELLTNKILFRTDIEGLTNIPVVAEIVKVKDKNTIVVNNNNTEFSCIEQFRQLRAAIGLNGRHLKHKKILVTSSIASEGKSFICNNLALSLAMSGRKVVLIDLDLRNPKTSELNNLLDKKGIANFLGNNEETLNEIIYPTDNQKLYIIPAGCSSSTNPTELMLSGDFKKLFNYLESIFDFIIIDTSPIDPVTDAYIISEYCDATLFVIRHGYTPKAMVELLEESDKVHALKNISIVFNSIKSRGFLKKRFGMGYGYGRKKIYGENYYQGIRKTNNKS